MAEYKRVAQVGATGNLGPAILKGLVDAGFEVTVLVRTAGKLPAEYASKVKEVVVDFGSEASVTSALAGQDVLISTVGHTGLTGQLTLIKAAVAAGVKRFIPSDFGSDVTQPGVRALPLSADKVKASDLLEQEVAKPGATLTYTRVINNLFLDWCLNVGFFGDISKKKATTYDGGANRVSLTRLSTVAQGVVSVLKHPAETANKIIHIHDGAASHLEVLQAVQEVVGADGWTIEDQKLDDVLAKSNEAASRGVFEPWVIVGYVAAAALSEKNNPDFTGRTWNKVLGIKEHSPEEVKALVKEITKGIVAK